MKIKLFWKKKSVWRKNKFLYIFEIEKKYCYQTDLSIFVSKVFLFQKYWEQFKTHHVVFSFEKSKERGSSIPFFHPTSLKKSDMNKKVETQGKIYMSHRGRRSRSGF